MRSHTFFINCEIGLGKHSHCDTKWRFDGKILVVIYREISHLPLTLFITSYFYRLIMNLKGTTTGIFLSIKPENNGRDFLKEKTIMCKYVSIVSPDESRGYLGFSTVTRRRRDFLLDAIT